MQERMERRRQINKTEKDSGDRDWVSEREKVISVLVYTVDHKQVINGQDYETLLNDSSWKASCLSLFPQRPSCLYVNLVHMSLNALTTIKCRMFYHGAHPHVWASLLCCARSDLSIIFFFFLPEQNSFYKLKSKRSCSDWGSMLQYNTSNKCK